MRFPFGIFSSKGGINFFPSTPRPLEPPKGQNPPPPPPTVVIVKFCPDFSDKP